MTSKPIGCAFDDFLKADGIYKKVTAHAIKCVLVWPIEHAMAARIMYRGFAKLKFSSASWTLSTAT